jgi:hypothetical protein
MKRLIHIRLAFLCLVLTACARQSVPAYVHRPPSGKIVLTVWVGNGEMIDNLAKKVDRLHRTYSLSKPQCSWAHEVEFTFDTDPDPNKLKRLFDTLKLVKYVSGYATTRRING